MRAARKSSSRKTPRLRRTGERWRSAGSRSGDEPAPVGICARCGLPFVDDSSSWWSVRRTGCEEIGSPQPTRSRQPSSPRYDGYDSQAATTVVKATTIRSSAAKRCCRRTDPAADLLAQRVTRSDASLRRDMAQQEVGGQHGRRRLARLRRQVPREERDDKPMTRGAAISRAPQTHHSFRSIFPAGVFPTG